MFAARAACCTNGTACKHWQDPVAHLCKAATCRDVGCWDVSVLQVLAVHSCKPA